MKLKLIRDTKAETYTLGRLYIDGDFFCDILEDPDRNLSSDMSLSDIKKIKVYGSTAIPTGNYKITLDIVSEKFKNRSWAEMYGGKIPRLLSVPGFDGILIHPSGNTPTDTLGCLLCGRRSGKSVIESTITFHKLMKALLSENTITIEIV